MFVDIIKVYTL